MFGLSSDDLYFLVGLAFVIVVVVALVSSRKSKKLNNGTDKAEKSISGTDEIAEEVFKAKDTVKGKVFIKNTMGGINAPEPEVITEEKPEIPPGKWKCENCETINAESTCVVCGASKTA